MTEKHSCSFVKHICRLNQLCRTITVLGLVRIYLTVLVVYWFNLNQKKQHQSYWNPRQPYNESQLTTGLREVCLSTQISHRQLRSWPTSKDNCVGNEVLFAKCVLLQCLLTCPVVQCSSREQVQDQNTDQDHLTSPQVVLEARSDQQSAQQALGHNSCTVALSPFAEPFQNWLCCIDEWHPEMDSDKLSWCLQ